MQAWVVTLSMGGSGDGDHPCCALGQLLSAVDLRITCAFGLAAAMYVLCLQPTDALAPFIWRDQAVALLDVRLAEG